MDHPKTHIGRLQRKNPESDLQTKSSEGPLFTENSETNNELILPPIYKNKRKEGDGVDRVRQSLTQSAFKRVMLVHRINPQVKYKKKRGCPCVRSKRKTNITVRENRFKYMSQTEKKNSLQKLWKKAINQVIKENKTKKQGADFLKHAKSTESGTKSNSLKFLILPGSYFRIIWDLLMLVFIGYMCIVTPFVLSFYTEISEGIEIFEYFICIVFAIDILITFFSAYYEKSQLITSKSTIALRYIRSYFIIDLISCIPINTLFADETHNNDSKPYNSKRMYVLLVLLKLLKLYRILHFIQFFIDKVTIKFEIRPEAEKGLKALLGLIFSVHIFACMWFLIARVYNFGPDTWVVRTGYQDAAIGEQYLVAVYWVFQTLTTVGYGDVAAVTAGERILSLVLMSFGVFFYSSLFQPMDEKQKNMRRKMVGLALYAKQYNVPNGLIAKIRNHFEEHEDDFYEHLNQGQLFEELPIHLRGELIQYSYGATITRIKIFQNQNPEFYWEIGSKLRRIKVNDGIKIYSEGDVPDKIYFVKSGTVQMVDNYGNVQFSYAANTYFGEQEFLRDSKRTVTAVSVGEVEFYTMEIKAFWNALKKHPEIQNEIQNLAKRRSQISLSSSPMQNLKVHSFNLSKLETIQEVNKRSSLFQRIDVENRPSISPDKEYAHMTPIREGKEFPKFEKFIEWKERIGPQRCSELIQDISDGNNGIQPFNVGQIPEGYLSQGGDQVNRNIKESLEFEHSKEGNEKAQALGRVMEKVMEENKSLSDIQNKLKYVILFLAYIEHIKSLELDS